MRIGKVHVEGRFVDPRLKAVVAFDPAKATGLVDTGRLSETGDGCSGSADVSRVGAIKEIIDADRKSQIGRGSPTRVE